MEKVIKVVSDLSGHTFTLTVSERLKKEVEGQVQAPEKLAAANERLKNLKTPLPK